MLDELFSAIDGKDPEKFVSFLSPECVFRFGNLPPVTGIEEIKTFVAGFFDSISALSHNLESSWEVPGGLICHGYVSYTRKNGSVLTVPFANVFKTDSAGVTDYLIFTDTSQLYA